MDALQPPRSTRTSGSGERSVAFLILCDRQELSRLWMSRRDPASVSAASRFARQARHSRDHQLLPATRPDSTAINCSYSLWHGGTKV